MEGMLTKEQWLRFPPKPNDAKLNECGRRLHLILTATVLFRCYCSQLPGKPKLVRYARKLEIYCNLARLAV